MRLWVRSTFGPLAVRFGPSLLVVAAVVALLAADRQERLGYVRALAWPVVTLVGFVALRDVLRERVANMRRASGLGFELEFQERQNNAVLEEEVREAANVLTEDHEDQAQSHESPGQRVNGSERERPNLATSIARAQELTGRALDEVRERAATERAQRRAAVEQAIKAGAEWGYNMAALYEAVPEPVIDWNDQGEPTITGARGRRRNIPRAYYVVEPEHDLSVKSSQERAVISRAEDEVRRRERELHTERMKAGPKFGEQFAVEGQLEERLKDAKRRLALLDPTSPLLL